MALRKRYQNNFSASSTHMFDAKDRVWKGKKIAAVLSDFLGSDVCRMKCLDVGCSAGHITNLLSDYCLSMTGVDIDAKAIEYAKKNHTKTNLQFLLDDVKDCKFPDSSFDLVIVNNVYEHVPSSVELFQEIKRILRPGGVVYFSAENRLSIIEPHYKLPFLSWLPKGLANKYLKICRGIPEYYETLLSLWGLKSLVSEFRIIDYTRRIIKNPEKFFCTDLIPIAGIGLMLCKILSFIFYPILPHYIWILQKK